MCNVTVVDQIMSSGKSTKLINNLSHEKRQFVVFVPTRLEVERYLKQLPNTVTPAFESNKKTVHFTNMILDGKSVIATHSLLTSLSNDQITALILKNVLIYIDETPPVFEKLKISMLDIEVMIEKGVLDITTCVVNDLTYYKGELNNGRLITDGTDCYSEFEALSQYRMYAGKMRNRITYTNDKRQWLIPMINDRLFRNLQVTVLTYNYPKTDLECYFKFHQIEVLHISDGLRGSSFKSLIEIVDHRINSVGEKVGKSSPLTAGWWAAATDEQKRIVSNATYTYFKRIVKTNAALNMVGLFSKTRKITKRLNSDNTTYVDWWDTYNVEDSVLQKPFDKVKRLSKNASAFEKAINSCGVVFNARATNMFNNRTSLAYLVDVYFDNSINTFFETYGIKVDQDTYALNTLLQWIFRSAIRNGKKITLFLPSARMRNLLNNWLNS
jgi:hypothetical protein